MITLMCITVVAFVNTVQAVCPSPQIANSGEITADLERLANGSYSTYTALFLSCKEGYVLLGSNMLVCMEEDTWDPLPNKVICRKENELSCPEADLPLGATTQGGVKNGDILTYVCGEHLRVDGDSRLKCTDGQWSGDVPTCQRSAFCLDPGRVTGGNRTIHKSFNLDNFGPGDRIQYRCYHGSPRSSSLNLTCQESGEWDYEPPKCPDKIDISRCADFSVSGRTCPEPGQPNNGYVLKRRGSEPCDGRHAPGVELTVRCNDGFLFRNKQTLKHLKCQSNGLWNAELPICYDQTYCADPGTVNNSRRTPLDLDFPLMSLPGDEILYQCDPGYTVNNSTDQAVITCKDNGFWDYDPPFCTKRASSITYCDQGPNEQWMRGNFENALTKNGIEPTLVYDGSNKLLESRAFSPDELICRRPKKIACGKIQYKDRHKTKFFVNETVTFVCKKGYGMSGSHILTCTQEMLGWDSVPPICIPKCSGGPNVKLPTMGKSTPCPCTTTTTAANKKSDSSVYRTTPVPVTESRRRSTIKTENQSPTSRRKTRLEIITKATTLNENMGPDTNRYVPTSQQHLNNSITTVKTPATDTPPTPTPDIITGHKTVDKIGKKGNSTNENRKIGCNHPGEIDNADLEPPLNPNRFQTGQTIRVTCKEGFVLQENKNGGVMTCLDTGEWDSHPSCVRKVCPEPGMVDHATRSPNFEKASNYFGPGQPIKIFCDHGYMFDDFYDEVVLTCKRNGTWDEALPTCKEIRCEKPQRVPKHASVSPSREEEFPVGSTLTYSCKKGYELHGPRKLTCDHSTGDWDLWLPTCKAMKCPHPGTPENGRRIGHSFRVGDTVTFACSFEHELLGSQSRECLDTKKWSGEDPICSRKDSYCPPLPTPVGGLKMGQSYDMHDVVTFTCSEDFYLIGSSERKCLSDGKWSGRPAHCEYKYSYSNANDTGEDVRKFMDAISMDTNSSDIGSNLRSGSCQNGVTYGGLDLYLLFDVSGSIEERDLKAFRELSKAIVDKVGVSKAGTRIALIIYNSNVQSRLKLLNEGLITPETVKHSIDRIIHTGGGTATATAFRHIRDQLLDRKTGRQNRPHSRKVIILMTDGKHNTGGNPVPVAAQLKRAPYDMDIYCVGVGPNTNKKSLNDIASSPEKFWLLRTAPDVKTVTEYLLAEVQTTYDISGVGGPSNVPEDTPPGGSYKVDDIRDWPWVATVYYHQGNGECSADTLNFLCGASLIDRQWLITAGSCFRGGKADASRLHVKIGSRYGKDRAVILDVAKVILHEYQEDNDIALIRLKKPVILTPKIRTVALPETSNNGRISTALLSGAASPRRLAEDTQQNPSPSHIILTPGQPVAAEQRPLYDQKPKITDSFMTAKGPSGLMQWFISEESGSVRDRIFEIPPLPLFVRALVAIHERRCCLCNPLSDSHGKERYGWTVGFVAQTRDSHHKGTGQQSPPLHQAMVYRLHRTSCAKTSKSHGKRFSAMRSFCATHRTGRVCIRDSGFPFMVQQSGEHSGRIVQTGILSWSTSCNGVFFTKVEHYVQWINTKISESQQIDQQAILSPTTTHVPTTTTRPSTTDYPTLPPLTIY